MKEDKIIQNLVSYNKDLSFNKTPSEMGVEESLGFQKITLVAVLRINSQTLKAEAGNSLFLNILKTYISAIG